MENSLNWEKEGFVSIWMGDFQSESEFNEYIEEKYGEMENNRPLSPFSQDSGLGWYDHDFREAAFFGEKLRPRKMLIGASYSTSFIDAAAEKASKKNIEEANAVFILLDCDFQPPEKEKGKLKFIASLPYDINSQAAAE